VCDNFSTFPTPPFPFVETETGIVTGGTGSFSGVTGTYTAMVRGAQLSLDATGVRGVGWFKNNVVTTLNGHYQQPCLGTAPSRRERVAVEEASAGVCQEILLRSMPLRITSSLRMQARKAGLK
jgi:hypothetical protein